MHSCRQMRQEGRFQHLAFGEQNTLENTLRENKGELLPRIIYDLPIKSDSTDCSALRVFSPPTNELVVENDF